MKKGIRISVIVLLFLAGAGFLTWYLLMRRQVPQHAQCIPKNAVAVLTLNIRELALDRATGGHLFPEMADKKAPEELALFLKSIEKNDGSGLSATADVLGFLYREGESAFFGVAASLKDSATFGKLIRKQLANQFPIHLQKGGAMLRYDTTSAILGWNNDIVLFLYPFSNETSDKTAEQCAKLLKQAKEQSVLADENFCEHELSSFDAGVWIQPKKILAFTGGSALQRVMFENINYISLAIDFQEGETIMRKIITTDKPSSTASVAPVLLTCDPKQVLGYYRGVLNLQNDSLLDDYADVVPLNRLKLADERTVLLSKNLNGNYTVLLHDTFSFDSDYIFYDYDADFNRMPMHKMKKEITRGSTISFGVKDQDNARKLLTEWMMEDSIPLTGNTWTLKNQNAQHYMMLTDNVLTISNWKQSDGKPREIPVAWEGLDVFLPVGDIIIPELFEGVAFLFPQFAQGEPLFKENIDDLLISQPLIVGNENSSQVRLTMHNKKVNALVQFEELFRKIAEAK
ncbi:hypothetical protein BH11BAC7_BH11BAC7_14020 [soil metagenome]